MQPTSYIVVWRACYEYEYGPEIRLPYNTVYLPYSNVVRVLWGQLEVQGGRRGLIKI